MTEKPSARLLIVEDDRAIARALERNLTRSGLHCRIAFDGREAIEALQSAEFDFILCDYQLPDTTAESICRYVRLEHHHNDIPIALCTAKTHEVDVAALIGEYGLTNIFSKPFSLLEITAEIHKSLEKCSRTSPL